MGEPTASHCPATAAPCLQGTASQPAAAACRCDVDGPAPGAVHHTASLPRQLARGAAVPGTSQRPRQLLLAMVASAVFPHPMQVAPGVLASHGHADTASSPRMGDAGWLAADSERLPRAPPGQPLLAAGGRCPGHTSAAGHLHRQGTACRQPRLASHDSSRLWAAA